MKYLLFVSVIVLSSCSLFDNEQIDEPQLIGVWEWEESYGGFAGMHIHSDSVDYSMQLRLLASGKASWYKNGEKTQEYEVYRAKEGDLKGELIMKPVASTESAKIVKVIYEYDGATLKINDYCVDCYSYVFVR
ncbi:MAG: hypothetical protein FH748_04350 [Balneolaceae bacterium]|nr:hypothetical protein [Balneolaceae bacterium]